MKKLLGLLARNSSRKVKCTHGQWYGFCMFGCKDPYNKDDKNFYEEHGFDRIS